MKLFNGQFMFDPRAVGTSRVTYGLQEDMLRLKAPQSNVELNPCRSPVASRMAFKISQSETYAMRRMRSKILIIE